MCKTKQFFLFIFACSSLHHFVYSMEHEKKPELHIYAVPGRSGWGSDSNYIESMLPENVPAHITQVETPQYFPDMGQGACIRLLEQAIKHISLKNTNIIWATSQGTATVLNRLAQKPQQKIDAVILDSTLVSGNSAIVHYVRNSDKHLFMSGIPKRAHLLTKLPYADYWLPYLAGIDGYTRYFPAGRQPIKSACQIPNNLLIIMIHATRDKLTPYSDACELYDILRKRGNNNVYFITKDSEGHSDLLEKSDKPILEAILQKHSLLPKNKEIAVDLAPYQPDPEQFKPLFTKLYKKEMRHEKICHFFIFVMMLMLAHDINQWLS
jgi:hypothetical protein